MHSLINYAKMLSCFPFPGYLSVLIIDNACIHHSKGILDLADRFHLFSYLSLPIINITEPQNFLSSFFHLIHQTSTQIEEAFSKVKAFIWQHRALLANKGDGMLFDLMQIMEAVASSDAIGYFIQ